MKNLILLLFGILVIAAEAMAQDFFDSSIFVPFRDEAGAQLFNNGGYHNPNFANIDLNNDGREDLIIMERYPYKLETYIARSVPDSRGSYYDFQPEYADEIAEVNGYIMAKDMNCDGVKDILDRGIGGVRIQYGYYDTNSEWRVSSIYEPKFYNPATGFSNFMYVAPNGDRPLITDIDGDGDIDVLAFDILIPGLVFYKNFQVENNHPCDSNEFVVSSWCYGNLSRSDSFWTNNYLCKTDGLGKVEHSTLVCMEDLDIDNDAALDILSGSSSSSSINLLYNTGTNLNPYYNMQDTLWGPASQSFFMQRYMCPYIVDYNLDGHKDMLISTNDYSGINHRNIYPLKNSGNHQYQFDTTSFMFRLGLDEGIRSRPVFHDHDYDGDLDLFIAVDSSSSNKGSKASHIVYYENKGTNTTPEYEKEDEDFLMLSNSGLNSLHISFGDLDNDEVPDVLLGHGDGMAYVLNLANTAQAAPIYDTLVPELTAVEDAKIANPARPFSFLTPLLFDFDMDGDDDILCGEKYGNIMYFENTGTANTMTFEYKIYFTGGIDVSGDQDPIFSYFTSWEGYSVPWISAIDSTDSLYIHVGNMDGLVLSYLLDTSVYNYFSFHDTILNKGYGSTLYSAPTFGRIHGDSTAVMLVGNHYGGLYSFQRTILIDTSEPEGIFDYAEAELNIYPNPNTGRFRIDWQQDTEFPVQIEVYNILGALVQRTEVYQKEEELSFDLKAQQHYFLRARSSKGGPIYTARFLVE